MTENNLPNAVYAREAKLIPIAWGPWSLSKVIKTESWGVADVVAAVGDVVVVGFDVVVIVEVVRVDDNEEIFFELAVGVFCDAFVSEGSFMSVVSSLFLEHC